MKQTLLIAILLITISSNLLSSELEHFALSIGYNGLNESNSFQGARINGDIQIDYIDFNAVSVAIQSDGTKIKISSNGIISLAGGLGIYLGSNFKDSSKTTFLNPIGTVLKTLLTLQMLTNPTIKTALIKDKLDIIYSLKTDYYFLYEDSRIYCEGVLGLRGRIDNVGLEANLGIPFTNGYVKDKTPYFGARMFYFL
ncbi:MAG: hypothetical protein JST20_11670 [Bacteroidetes bacterium]|nr:hypothetical protein [Bacteroidota bacterium]